MTRQLFCGVVYPETPPHRRASKSVEHFISLCSPKNHIIGIICWITIIGRCGEWLTYIPGLEGHRQRRLSTFCKEDEEVIIHNFPSTPSALQRAQSNPPRTRRFYPGTRDLLWPELPLIPLVSHNPAGIVWG